MCGSPVVALTDPYEALSAPVRGRETNRAWDIGAAIGIGNPRAPHGR
jgi:hypothetical protein